MLKQSLSVLCAAAGVTGQIIGFNYGDRLPDGRGRTQQIFEDEFNTARNLVGTEEFTSARLFTMVESDTKDTLIPAIPAAIKTQTSLLLGIWCSAGEEVFQNEIRALKTAVDEYGTAFADLVLGISVGSEDLHRNSGRGVGDPSGGGEDPEVLIDYIRRLREYIKDTPLADKPVGHVDTSLAYNNETNKIVIDELDFLGHDGYPYFEDERLTPDNSIEKAQGLFFEGLEKTKAVAKGKPVWVTESGWPVTGKIINKANPGLAEARKYWVDVLCKLKGSVNVFWFILNDASPLPDASFGVIDQAPQEKSRYDLTCPEY